MGEAEEQTRQRSAQQRTENGDGGIAPVRVPFAWNGQQRVRQPRSEVACGIDGVARGAAKREADAPYKRSDQPWSYARCWSFFRDAGRKDGSRHDDQHGGSDDLAEEVSPRLV